MNGGNGGRTERRTRRRDGRRTKEKSREAGDVIEPRGEAGTGEGLIARARDDGVDELLSARPIRVAD
jgi:hypothetical protein